METLQRKTGLFFFKSPLVTIMCNIILTSLLPPPPPHFKLFLQVLSMHGLLLLATLIREGGGITSTRSWTGHLSQNKVQCLKYFCNWLYSGKREKEAFFSGPILLLFSFTPLPLTVFRKIQKLVNLRHN